MSALQREKEALQLECVGLQREQRELQRELRRMSEGSTGGSMEGHMEGSMGEAGPSGQAGAAADLLEAQRNLDQVRARLGLGL